MKTLTDYKDSKQITSRDQELPDTLNQFFARLNTQDSRETVQLPQLSEQAEPLVLQCHQVRTPVRKTDVSRAAVSDGVSGRILKSCADQPARVFLDIFNLSVHLSVALVLHYHTCAKEVSYYLPQWPSLERVQSPQHSTQLCHIRSSLTLLLGCYLWISAFNTMIPHKLAHKLHRLGMSFSLCSW